MSAARTAVTATALRDRCQAAIELLDRAINEPPSKITSDLYQAERTVARLRDELIEVTRGAPAPGVARPRAALDRVNAALSLIVGVEYPVKGIHREMIEQARDALRAVQGDELA